MSSDPMRWPLRPLAVALCGVFFSPVNAWAADAEAPVVFESTFLHRGAGDQSVDLSVFSFANRVLPGLRVVDVVLNGTSVGKRNVSFRKTETSQDAQPCVTVALLEDLSFNIAAFPELQNLPADTCVELSSFLGDTTVAYNTEANQLALSIPQAALLQTARGLVPRELWDDGTTAFWASYRASRLQSRYKDQQFGGHNSQHTTFGSMRAGFNMGAWRLRSNMSYYDSTSGHDFDLSEIYLERDVADWGSRLRIGDATSPGSAFGATRFRGVQLRSEEAMRPDSQRGYAPTVQGVAMSNAKVTVRQNGYVIYTTFVPPGPFTINDLYATPGGGDLEVEVQETGGASTTYVQPYAALPTMVREGVWDYSVLAGEYRNNSHGDERPWMAQGTFAHGLFSGLTVYGGLTGARRYYAGSLGVVFNLESMGALSMDITRSHSRMVRDDRQVGNAMRIQYSKVLNPWGTDFRVLGYRYSSSGYRSLNEAVAESEGTSTYYYGGRRSHEYQMSVSQRLGNYGNVSANWFRTSYHNLPGNTNTFRFGYNFSTPTASYYVSYDIERNPWQRHNNQIMFQVSIPFGNGRHLATYAFSRSSQGGVRNQAGLSGAMTEDYAGTYSLRASTVNNNGKVDTDGFASANYLGRYGQASASYGHTRYSNQMQLEVSGAVVVDAKGPIFGQTISETAIIIDAPGAEDVALQNRPGVRTNAQGRALMPSAVPYRENRVSLAPGYTSDKVSLSQDVKRVVPTYGAIVVASFETEAGRTELFTLRGPGGIVPFGSVISDADGVQKGVVGPAGRAWLSGLTQNTRYHVKWGQGASQQCEFEVIVDKDAAQPNNMQPKETTCE